MRTTVYSTLFVAALTLLPLSAAAGRLSPPQHSVGVVFGESFVGVLVYDDDTEFRVANDWYRLPITAAQVERAATASSIALALLTLGAVGYILRRRWVRNHASSTPTGSA